MIKEKIIVSKKQTGKNVFATVAEAIDYSKAVSGAVEIQIAPGIYKEKLTIDVPSITLVGMGATPDETVLTYDDYALDKMEDGSNRGTFRSYSVFLDANGVTLKNLTIENASGDSKTHGQAIALYAEGDGLLIENCRLLGHQDTLFTGPLPPKELQKNGFIGPKQYAPRINGHQHYKNCYICGDVDFIFGSATCYFEDCTIESLLRDPEIETQGYVTAASTAEGQDYGYVFENCSLISSGCPDESVYLGRPWRNFAKTVYLNCRFGSHIKMEGFHDWNKADAHSTIFYSTFGCTRQGLPFTGSAAFITPLAPSDLALFSKDNVLGLKK